MDESPDYSLIANDRLVAYIWQRENGHLRHAGAKGKETLAEIAFAEILVFDPQRASTIKEIVLTSRDFDTLLFKLGVEGFDVAQGTAKPNARHRRF